MNTFGGQTLYGARDAVQCGDASLCVALGTCILREQRTLAGDCAYAGQNDGPPRFARFQSITRLVRSVDLMVALDANNSIRLFTPSEGVRTMRLADTHSQATDIATHAQSVAVVVDGCLRVYAHHTEIAQWAWCPTTAVMAVASDDADGWYVYNGTVLSVAEGVVVQLPQQPPMMMTVVKMFATASTLFVVDGVARETHKVRLRQCAVCPLSAVANTEACVQRPPGHSALGPCAAGTFNPWPASTTETCTPCPPFTYAPTEGHVYCRACNTTHPLRNARGTACVQKCDGVREEVGACVDPCTPGSSYLDGVCTVCPAMHYMHGSVCVPCAPGFASNAGATACYIRCTEGRCPRAPTFDACDAVERVPPQVLFALEPEDVGAVAVASTDGQKVYVGTAKGLSLYKRTSSLGPYQVSLRWPIPGVTWGAVLAISTTAIDDELTLLLENDKVMNFTRTEQKQWPSPSHATGLAACAQPLFVITPAGLWRWSSVAWQLWYAQEGVLAAACQQSHLFFTTQTSVWWVEDGGGARVLLAPQTQFPIRGGLAIWGGLPTVGERNGIRQLTGPLEKVEAWWPYALSSDRFGTQLFFMQPGDATVMVLSQVTSCLCAQDWYREPWGACLPCPSGTHAEAGATQCSPSPPLSSLEEDPSQTQWFTEADALILGGTFVCVSRVAVAPCKALHLPIADGGPSLWYAMDCADSRPEGAWRLEWSGTLAWRVWQSQQQGQQGEYINCAYGYTGAPPPPPCHSQCEAHEIPLYIDQGCPSPNCMPVLSIAGMRATYSFINQSANLQYVPCLQEVPEWAEYVAGPDPTTCYFACLYGVNDANVAPFYAARLPDTTPALQGNLFPFSQPQAIVVCLPCRLDTPCAIGRWRPPYDGTVSICGAPCFLYPSLCATAVGDCTGHCALPLEGARFTGGGNSSNTTCAWTCNAGYFRDGDQCRPCVASQCSPDERFVPPCGPSRTREDVCKRCPTFETAISVRRDVASTTCVYECVQPSRFYLRPSLSLAVLQGLESPCVECSLQQDQSCPAGYKHACQPELCARCPSLTPFMIALPSATDTCMAQCEEGRETWWNGSSVPRGAYAQALLNCSTPRSAPVTNVCAPRTYLSTQGSCEACPTHASCGTGWYRTACEPSQPRPPCIPCAPISSATTMYVPYTTTTSACPLECVTNFAPNSKGLCTPCASYNTAGLSFFAVWNASKAVRWWPRSMDKVVYAASSLPPRSSDTMPETRARLCWPCPTGTTTPYGATDLCNARIAAVAPMLSTAGLQFKGGRALLQHKHACGAPYASPETCECPIGAYMRRCLTPLSSAMLKPAA